MTFTSSSARKAGKSKTPAKRASSRANGILGGPQGGRPKGSVRNLEIERIRKEHNCSRAWAYRILKSARG